MIEIVDLHVRTGGKEILKGVNLCIQKGTSHAVMGPNGAGKSTLAYALSGHPAYEVFRGEVWFKGQNLLVLPPEDRACLGLFMSFQYPLEIPGVSNREFLYAALNAQRKCKGLELLSDANFQNLLEEKMQQLQMRFEFSERNVNEGFSGGEKKRNEILQMALLNPDFAILDEMDSGLDIDALRSVAQGIKRFQSSENALLIITHYQRLLELLQPDFIHVLADGRIVQSGTYELALELEDKGFSAWSV